MKFYKTDPSQSLSPELFKNPTKEYRGAPFWAWNCRLDKDRLSRQIHYFKEMGFGGYHMHVRTGLVTKYLSDEFFDFIRHCVDEGEKTGMFSYLYDEDRWPSGFAGGLVTKPNPRFRQRYLQISVKDTADDLPRFQAIEEGKNFFLAAFRIHLDENGKLVSYEKVDRSENGPDIRYFYCMCAICDQVRFNHTCYVDTLSKPAIDEFLRITYEAYYRAVGDRFGKSVPSIFTDEPRQERSRHLPSAINRNDARLPFAFDFIETFKDVYGFDLTDHLPELFFEEEEDKHFRARYCYYDHFSERFASAFMDNLSEWSEKHGILQTGHLMGEASLLLQSEWIGEAMRSYRKVGMIGMDLLCNWKEFTTAKQCQSAVHQFGRDAMLSELYGVCNWDFDFRNHKYQGDWQAAMGVTVRVPHLSWMSMHGEAKRDYPASINYQSPWFKEYKFIEDHFSRVNTAMSRGKPVCDIGVIHPIESYWLLCGSLAETNDKRNELEKQFTDTIDWLLESSLDFEFIAESLLPGLFHSDGQTFGMGEMRYKAVVLPCLITLRKTTLAALEEFSSNGGTIVFLGECPRYVDALPDKEGRIRALYERSIAIPARRSKLVESLRPVRRVTLRREGAGLTDDLCYSLREEGDSYWMFIAHLKQKKLFDEVVSKRLEVVFDGSFDVEYFDTLSGEIRPADYSRKNGKTHVYREVFFNDSLLYHFVPASGEKERERPIVKKTVWQCDFRDGITYRRQEKNVVLLDMVTFNLDGKEFTGREEILRADDRVRDHLGIERRGSYIMQPYLLSEQPEDHALTLRYDFCSEIECDGALLAIENPQKCRILFNGEEIDNTPAGWYVDEDIKTVRLPRITVGKNVITVEMPFGQKTDVEACYLLGDFGVRVNGCVSTLIADPERIGFGSLVEQGMPFYSGNMDYLCEVDLPEDGELIAEVGMYRGAMVKVTLDEDQKEDIVFPPYKVSLGEVKKGKHTLKFTLFGMRYNTFAALHNVRSFNVTDNFDANFWRSKGSTWSYEYIFKRFGILKSPVVYLQK